ncbi:TonB family protein [bacterium]|nr:TonB family protein [bacterium]
MWTFLFAVIGTIGGSIVAAVFVISGLARQFIFENDLAGFGPLLAMGWIQVGGMLLGIAVGFRKDLRKSRERSGRRFRSLLKSGLGLACYVALSFIILGPIPVINPVAMVAMFAFMPLNEFQHRRTLEQVRERVKSDQEPGKSHMNSARLRSNGSLDPTFLSSNIQQESRATPAPQRSEPSWQGNVQHPNPKGLTTEEKLRLAVSQFRERPGNVKLICRNSSEPTANPVPGDFEARDFDWGFSFRFGIQCGDSDRATGRPEGSGFEVSGGLDRETVRRITMSYRGKLRACYERAQLSQPRLAGQVVIHYEISGKGAVLTASIKASDTNSSMLDSCLLEMVRQMMFPEAPSGANTLVSFPFTFEARSN